MPTQLKGWLEDFPRDEVEGRIDTLERELLGLRNALAMHDALSGRNGRAELAEGEIPTKPQAITMILQEGNNRPLTPAQIRAAMVERGWLGDGPKYAKRFYATMSRLNGESRIIRQADGRYVLPPNLFAGVDMP